MNEYQDQGGKWITVKGRRVFIRDGESNEGALNRTFGIVNPPKNDDKFENLIDKHKGEWDFRGEATIVDELESKAAKSKSVNALSNLYSACMKWDKHITTLYEQVENGQDEGDLRNLMTLRRRIRTLQRKIKSEIDNK